MSKPVAPRNNSQSTAARSDPIAQRIAGIKAQRGYVMTNHAFLASLAPDVLEAYEVIYALITNKKRVMTALEKNFVWIVVVGCSEVPIGGHHVHDFLDAGGDKSQVEAAAVVAMIASGARLIDTVEPGWQKIVAGLDLRSAYERAVVGAAPANISTGVVHAALAAGQACRRAWDKVALHILRAKEAGVADETIAEALLVSVLPSGNPSFVQACAAWRDLIREGKVKASPELERALQLI